MDLIESMGVLAKVIEKQSFSGAARELRLSQAAVSKHVRALEDWLGGLLLNRTTRRPNVNGESVRRFTNGANVVSTRSRWFSRAPARCRLHRAACCIWSLRSRSVSSARPRACRLSLARIPGELILRVSVWLWPGITPCVKTLGRSIAIEQISHSRPAEMLALQAHSISRANTRRSFSSSGF